MIFATARRPDFTPEICEPWMRQARQATHFVAFFGAWTPPNCGGRKFWFDHVIRNHGIQSRNLGCNSFQRQVLKIIGFPNEITKNHTISVVLLDFLGPFESTWEIHGHPTRGESEFFPIFSLSTSLLTQYESSSTTRGILSTLNSMELPSRPSRYSRFGRDGGRTAASCTVGKSVERPEVVAIMMDRSTCSVFQMIQMLWISLDNFLSHVLILHLFQNGIPVSKTQLTFPNNSLISGWVSQREFVRLHWCFILMQVGQWILMTSVVPMGRGSAPQSWRNHPMYWRKETLSSVYTLHRILSQDFYFIYTYIYYIRIPYTYCMYTLAAFH